MLVKLAWRNIWRNKRRTAISISALSLGVMAIVSIHSFRESAYQEMVLGLTRGFTGNIQIHGRGYQTLPEVTNVVRDAAAVEAKVLASSPGLTAEKRILGVGLAGSPASATAAMVMGIEPTNPAVKSLFTLKGGEFLSDSPLREALIGIGLAAELQLGIGGELVLLAQAADGSLANDRFTVVGLVDAGSSEINASAVFLHLAQAQAFFSLEQSVHQIIVRLPIEQDDLAAVVSVLSGALDLKATEILPWNEILPEFEGAMAAKRKNSRMIDVIVFLIVSLGVLNTMSMSTFERTREFGVMASLGTRRKRILGLVALEAFFQGLLGFCVGVTLSWILLRALGRVDFSSLAGSGDMMGATLPDAISASIQPASVLAAGITTGLTVLIGGLFPAIRASRMKPVEATRYV